MTERQCVLTRTRDGENRDPTTPAFARSGRIAKVVAEDGVAGEGNLGVIAVVVRLAAGDEAQGAGRARRGDRRDPAPPAGAA